MFDGYFSIIIPAYLEAENLAVLLPKLNMVLSDNIREWEILVVDSMLPMDNTAEVIKNIPYVRYLSRCRGNSYGHAIITGIEAASGDKIIVMDADGSHDPAFLPLMLSHAKDNDIVIGSRYVIGGATDNPRILIFLSHCVNIAYQVFLNIKIHDVSNSFRIYDSKQLKSLKLVSFNFDLVEEILIKLIKNNPKIHIIEVPICFKKRYSGMSKRKLLSFALSYFVSILKLMKLRYMD